MIKEHFLKLLSVLKDYYSELKKVRFDRKLVIFAFFFLISTLLWFLQTLNHEYITTISQKVEFVGSYDTIVVQNFDELPKSLNIKVQAKGYGILRHNFSLAKTKVKLNFQNLNLIPEKPGDSIHFYFYTNTVKNYFQSKIGNALKVLEILPDTLSFNFTRFAHKTLQVVPHINLICAPGYRLKGKIKIEPEIIKVYAPEFILSTLDTIYTQKIELKNQNRDIKQKLKLDFPKRVEAEIKNVTISAHISQFTEISSKILINIINKPDSLRVIIFPNSISIKYQLFIEDIYNHKLQSSKAVVDFVQDSTRGKRMKVKLINPSEKMFNVRYYPKYVNFIVEKIK